MYVSSYLCSYFQEPGKNQLVSTYDMRNGLELIKFATILADLPLADKRLLESKPTGIDRFSKLPGPIIHRILSLLDTQSAVRTSVLSKEWKNHWKNISTINLHHSYISPGKFKQFIDNAKSISKHTRLIDLPTTSHLQSQCITTLTLIPDPWLVTRTFPDISSFASLTTLQLANFLLPSADPFSNCMVLKHLTLIDCSVDRGQTLIVAATKLITFDLKNIGSVYFKNWNSLVTITSPELKSFCFLSSCHLSFNLVGCPLLEDVFIQMMPLYLRTVNSGGATDYIDKVVNMTKVFHHVKSFTFWLESDRVLVLVQLVICFVCNNERTNLTDCLFSILVGEAHIVSR